MLWSFIYSLNLFFIEMYRDRIGEFVCEYWGLKGWIKFVLVLVYVRNFHTHRFWFILLFKVPKLKYGEREKQNNNNKQINKREKEQTNGAERHTTTADAS